MNSSILDLSHRLQKALDNNYNVTDMASVFAVISVLEVSTITKEQLETTRLAKFINQLRRKTKNESLARRSKNLIKKWRKMLMPTLAPTATTTAATTATPAQQLTGIQTKLQQKQLPTQIHSSNGQNNKNSDSLDGCSSCSSTQTTKSKILSKKPINFVNFKNQAEIYQHGNKPSSNQYSSDDRSSSPHQATLKTQQVAQPQTKSEQIALLLMENERSISPLAQKTTNKKKLENFSDDTKSSSNLFTIAEPSIDLIQDSISSSCDILLNLNKSMTSIETAAGCFSKRKSTKKKPKKVKRKRKENETESDDEPVIFHDSLSNTASLSRFSLTNYMTPLPQSESGPTTATATTTTTFSANSFSSLNPADLTFSGKFNQSTNFPIQIDENESVLIESSDDGEDSSGFTNFQVVDEPIIKPIEQTTATTNLVTDSRSISPFIDSGANSNGSNSEKTPTKMPTGGERSELVKKRGRKKGSKGADFLMSNMGYFGPGSAVYETASYLGIKSKIASFSGSQKKVKTTKELLADIQNKKIGSSTTSSPAHSYAQNLSPSSGSDISQHSNSNLTDLCNRSTTATPVSLATVNTSEPHRSDETPAVQTTAIIQQSATPNSIEQKIKEIYDSLPPIESDEIQLNDEILCSCVFREKEVEEEEVLPEVVKKEELEEAKVKKEELIPIVIEKPLKTPSVCILPKKPVRSIFDLDYDEDFDPGINYVEEKKPIVEDVKIVIECEQVQAIEQLVKPIELFVQQTDEQICQPIEPEQKWFCDEDENCMGKKIYETDKQQVTKFHIERLHNFCIPEINGNWNCRQSDDEAGEEDGEVLTKDVQSVERIVPKCNHLIIDKIPKDLRSCQIVTDCDDVKQLMKYKKSDKNDLLANNNNNCKKRRKRTKLRHRDDVIHSNEPTNDRLFESIDPEEEISSHKRRRISSSSSSSDSSATSVSSHASTVQQPTDSYQFLPDDNNHLLPSFNNLTDENVTGVDADGNKFKEWFQVVEMKSYNDEILTILPYVVID